MILENSEEFTWELNHHTLKISVLNSWPNSGTISPAALRKINSS
jgi:hypothetical protein